MLVPATAVIRAAQVDKNRRKAWLKNVKTRAE